MHSCRTKVNSKWCSHLDGCCVASLPILSSNIEKGRQTKMGKTVFFTKKRIVAVNMLISCTGGPSPRVSKWRNLKHPSRALRKSHRCHIGFWMSSEDAHTAAPYAKRIKRSWEDIIHPDFKAFHQRKPDNFATMLSQNTVSLLLVKMR